MSRTEFSRATKRCSETSLAFPLLVGRESRGKLMSRLQTLQSVGGTWVEPERVYHVTDPHTLTQAAGYLKFVLRSRGPILFRGQAQLHSPMLASLHRDVTTTSGYKKRETAFAKHLQAVRNQGAFIKNTPEYAQEALLQHYGIRTKWLDVVDNIWVALWFACHEARMLERHQALYLHFARRRRPYPDNGERNFAHVVLIQALDVAPVGDSPGLQRGKEAEVIDLRIAAPSLYIRPHAQHGLLIRKRNNPDLESCDLAPLVVGVIRVEIGDALDWLGRGDLLSVHSLFPPPHYDFGYRQLLQAAPPLQKLLGGIHHVGA